MKVNTDVYKVLHSLPLASSARLPPYLPLFYSSTLCTSAESVSVVALECGSETLDAAGAMPVDCESGVLSSSPGSSIY